MERQSLAADGAIACFYKSPFLQLEMLIARPAEDQRYIASPSKEIMDFEKYSKLQFESRGLDSPAARELADGLQDEVAKEIHDAVLVAFLKVVEGLNALGHNLQPYDEIHIGDISFRDQRVEGQCFLRLACDSTISAGYSHTTAHDAEAEIES